MPSYNSWATHIVGGEIYYELLNPSANLYTITLKIYMDCQNGNPQAIQSDYQAIIGVFDAGSKNYESQFTISKTGPRRVNEVNYNCVIPPTGICVDEYTYKVNRVINPGTRGKILAFQRCCRNNSITNLTNPEATGIAIWTKIPPNIQNSSAIFKKLPPNYVCVDAPLTVDHSATDSDGDVLVYSLTTPYTGGTPDEPRPIPSNVVRPDFKKVLWRSPYSAQNQMGGDPLMRINSLTGELTVTPKSKGQFAIGITVSEYRNGTLIGETRRDYQFNVIECEFDILADFTTEGAKATADAFVFECNDTVFFKDRSQKALSYHWDFGVENRTDDTSNLANPYFIYPGNGDYTVTLTVKNSLCEDEYSFDVRIRSVKTFELGPDIVLCKGYSTILDTGTPDATSVEWNTGQKGPRITTLDTGTFIAVVSYDACVYSDTLNILADHVVFSIPEDSLFCDDVDMIIDAGLEGPEIKYAWSTGEKTKTIRVTEAKDYRVAVSNLNCLEFDTIRIWQATQPVLLDAFYCNEFNHPIDAGEIEEASYLWSNGATSQATTYTTGGKQWLQITQRHCIKSDTFEISNPVINIDLGEDKHYCDNLFATLSGGKDGIKYSWNTGESTQTITVTSPGTYKVLVEDQYGCTKEDSVTLSLSASPTFDLGNDTTICLTSPTELKAPDGFAQYIWNTGNNDRIIVTETEGNYKVTIIDEYGCRATDSLYVTVDPEALPNDLYVPNAFTPNNDNLNELFPYGQSIAQPGYYVTIFTRWGEKVFDSRTSENQNWDGYYKGELVPQETFIYYVYYRGCDGNKRTRKGTVNPIY